MENKSGRIFCVRPVYKFLPINLGASKPFIYLFILYTTSEEKEYYEALFLSYRPRTKCSISQFFQDKLHSFNTQDHRRTRGLLISETVQKMFKITYTVCGPFVCASPRCPWSASFPKMIKYFVKKKNTLNNERYRDLLISILSYDEVSAFLLQVKTRN